MPGDMTGALSNLAFDKRVRAIHTIASFAGISNSLASTRASSGTVVRPSQFCQTRAAERFKRQDLSPVPLQVVHQDFVQESLDDQVVLSCSRHAVSLTCHHDLPRACSHSLNQDCVLRATDDRNRGRTRVRGAQQRLTHLLGLAAHPFHNRRRGHNLPERGERVLRGLRRTGTVWLRSSSMACPCESGRDCQRAPG